MVSPAAVVAAMKNGPPAVHRRREETGMNRNEPERTGRIAGSAEAAGVNGLIAVAELLELDGRAEAEKDIGRA